jgi:hypothetical protein
VGREIGERQPGAREAAYGRPVFIQVIQGRISDVDGLRDAVQRWRDEIAPQVNGWLGTTGGATADGTAIAIVRFESAQAARSNSDRPEQQQWWAEASRYFDGDVTFHDCPEVLTLLGGGSDDAGFVQIIQGRTSDVDRLRRFVADSQDGLREARPDVLGGTVALHGDGGFTEVIYFTSEAAAREGERSASPPEVEAELGELLRDATFFDLPRPWLHSPNA